MLTIERMKKFPEQKVVFLAPTRPLVEQHFNYFTKHLPELFAEMQIFTGKTPSSERKKIWENTDIIFSTPQCVANDTKKGLYNLKEVCLLIEDEAHRCLKKYSYKYVAQRYIKESKNPRILGLTASPGSDKEKIQKICKNLSVEELELRTRESEDVKQYLQELKFNPIKVDFPSEFEEMKQVLKKVYEEYVEELRARHVLYGPANKISLIELQKKIMHSLSFGEKNFNYLRGASICANAIKIQHALELLETQTIKTFNQYLKNLFEQAEKAKSKGIQQLVKKPEFNFVYSRTFELLAKNKEHPKLEKLIELVKEDFNKNPKTKIIVFAQFRDTVSIISKRLNEIKGVNAKVFVGQTKKGDEKNLTGLSQKEQQSIIKEFSSGKVNVLCATSIGEEGLDIPEVNAVIFYEPVASAIRKIQRAGRTARLIPGKLIILITKNTRDEIYYWASFKKEKKMYSAIDTIKKDLTDGKTISDQIKQEKQQRLK
jgi:Fanconi anemia group M protein